MALGLTWRSREGQHSAAGTDVEETLMMLEQCRVVVYSRGEPKSACRQPRSLSGPSQLSSEAGVRPRDRGAGLGLGKAAGSLTWAVPSSLRRGPGQAFPQQPEPRCFVDWADRIPGLKLSLSALPPGVLALEKATWQEAVGDGVLPPGDSVCDGCRPLPCAASSRHGAPGGNWQPCPPQPAGSELPPEAANKKPAFLERLGPAQELPGVC